MTLDLLPRFLVQSYEVYEWKHACAILKDDFPQEWQDLIAVLSGYRLSRQAVITAGGNLSPISKYFDQAFTIRGWAERKFDTRIVVDEEVVSPRHTRLTLTRTVSRSRLNGTIRTRSSTVTSTTSACSLIFAS